MGFTLALHSEILNTIFNNQMSIPFRNPVSESRNPEYRKFISKPMDLSTIKYKLKNNTLVFHQHCVIS